MGIALEVSPELAGRVRLGILTLEGVTVREADPGLAAEIEAYAAELRGRYGDGKSGDVPGAMPALVLSWVMTSGSRRPMGAASRSIASTPSWTP